MQAEKGNALFLILIAVALFAALSYAVTQSSRGGGGIAKEQAMIDTAVLQSYMAAINTGRMRLQLYGCGTIDYTPPADQSSGDDHSCHLFHPAGGGVAYRDLLDLCETAGEGSLEGLALGESCGGVVYAGTSGGHRIYAASSDQGAIAFGPNPDSQHASSTSDGMANTDLLVTLGPPGTYPAAEACRALGSDWYLPAREELFVMFSNRTIIGGFVETCYRSSNQYSGGYAGVYNAPDNSYCGNTNADPRLVRCAYRER